MREPARESTGVSIMVLDIFEIIEKVEKTNSKNEKVKILRQNESWALKDVLKGTYDEKIEWLIPEGDPPYKEAAEESHPSSIHKIHRNFRYLVKGGAGADTPQFKRERMFISWLEGVHPEDAKILLKMKDKKQLAKGLTVNLVEEAFPGLLVMR